jgi:endonuclease-3
MPTQRTNLSAIIAALRGQHDTPALPPASNAFELVIWEKAAYLTTDERRAAAFDLLRRTIGLTPDQILAAPRARLIDVLATGGIGAPERANNLREAAEIAVTDGDGSLDSLCDLPLADAKRALKRIRGIGDPGAEKILLLTRRQAVMGLDSNGLRVLTRLGYGREARSYSATYSSVTNAALPQLEGDIDRLIEANLLLRAHGRTICKTTRPRCSACSLRARCPSSIS